MDKELYLLFGAIIGAVAAYITAKVTTKAQLQIAHLNAEKELSLQQDRLKDERARNELEIKRAKLDTLHRTLSRIAMENSQTMSYMQSDEKLGIADFRKRYLENCERLHEAMAIADIHYPKMSASLRDVYGKSNIFWGYQENLLRTDITTNPAGWQTVLSEVIKAGDSIGMTSHYLKDKIAERATALSEAAIIGR